MATKERCLTRLLSDTPAETDAFGSHEKVARSIAEVVDTECGGKAIGLEGGWGSGKSTIVKLTAQELSETAEGAHKTVVFDMWSHQDDPLRRTFLESLISHLQEFEWVCKNKWDQRIAELAKRRREETTRMVPRLTPPGVGFALSLLAIPIGAALIGAGLSLLGFKDASAALGRVLLPVGIAIALAPAIYYGVLLVGFKARRGLHKGERSAGDGGLSELPALVTGQASTESRTVVTQTPDHTSVEFESMFRDLLDEALAEKDRKLLIVVDNLDRVEPTDALSIWATLQTFLSHRDHQRPAWVDRLWVLIPYDDNAILRLWDRSGSVPLKATKSPLATSFLDKTFQLRFRAPPLLLSSWREFRLEALRQALPDHQEPEFHGVCMAFAADGGLEAFAPTPRSLKIFVNQIGSLHREWQDEFPLSHLACYVLFQKKCDDVQGALVSNDEYEFLRQNIGQEWRGTIAALHFGKPVEEARQLLLRGPIQTALASGDGGTLSDLASTHHSGFWYVLEGAIPGGAEDWNSLRPPVLARAATALANSQILNDANRQPQVANLLSTVRTAAVEVRAWAPFDATVATGIVAIGQLVGDSEGSVSALLAGASDAPVTPSSEEQPRAEAAVSPDVWLDSMVMVIDGLLDLRLAGQLEEGVTISLSAEQWIDLAPGILEKDPEGRRLKHFDLTAMKEIDQRLAQLVSPDQIDDAVTSSIRATMATRSGNGLNDTTGAILSHLQSGQAIQGENLSFMLLILRSSRKRGLIGEDKYAEFAASGVYLHHLYHAISEGHPTAVAECMFGYMEAVPDASEPDGFGNSSDGYGSLNELLQDPDIVPGAVERFTDLAEKTQQLSGIFEMAIGKQSVPPFLVKALRSLLISNDVPKPVEMVRRYWSTIRDVLNEGQGDSLSFGDFLRGLSELEHLTTGVVDSTFDVLESGLYVELLKCSSNKDLGNWCSMGLAGVELDTWAWEIERNSDLVELAIGLKSRGTGMVLGPAYGDALVKYAGRIAEGLERVVSLETWNALFSILSVGQQELFSRRTYETLRESDGEASGRFFELFGDVIANAELLANDPRFIDRVCRPILESGDENGLAWVAKIAASTPSLLVEHGDQPAATDFLDRVQQHLNETADGDPKLPDLETIGTALGVTRVLDECDTVGSNDRPEEVEED